MMKICMVSREYPPETHVGGIGSYTHKTAGALAQLGHEVHVVTSAWKPATDYVEAGVHVHRFAEPQARPRQAQVLTHARAVAATIARIPGRLDIVQACEWQAEALWLALTPRRTTPLITRIATPHFLIRELNATRAPGLRGLRGQGMLVGPLEKLQTVRSDGIIAPSRAMADVVCRGWHIAPERITVVPSGISPAVVHAHEDGPLPEVLRGRKYLLYFGRLERRKGVHVLADALPAVLRAHPDLLAVFVGEDLGFEGGSMIERVRTANSEHADRLIFLPRMAHADLFPIVRGAHLVVLPSLWENLAHVCLEAMQLGRTVIATRHCAFGEMIEEGVSGLLAEPGDAPDLADRMLEALADPARLAAMGAAAQRQVARFEIGAMAAQLADYYEQVLARWRGARSLPAPAGTLTMTRS